MVAMKLFYVLALVSMMAGTTLAAPSPSELDARRQSPNTLAEDESPARLLGRIVEERARKVSVSPQKASNRPISHSLLDMCWNMQSQRVPLFSTSPRLPLRPRPNREALSLPIKPWRQCCLHASKMGFHHRCVFKVVRLVSGFSFGANCSTELGCWVVVTIYC